MFTFKNQLKEIKKFLILTSIFFSIAIFADNSQTPFEEYGLLQCNQPGFKCIPVRKGDTWADLFPDKNQRDMIMRLNRTNVALFYRSWLLEPKDMAKVKYMDLAPFPHHIYPAGDKLLLVDLKKFAFAAYDPDGNLVYWGPASGGQMICDDTGNSCTTALGTYRIFRIQGEDCESSKYPLETDGGAPMPWCMHYYKGFAIHGSTLSGFNNKSKGCVRLFDPDAKWLNQHFVEIGTMVIIKG